MNCDEYREAITAEPGFDGGAGHLADCESCQAYRRELLALDEKLARALAVPVPELVMPELPDVAGDNVVELSSRRRFGPPTWLALAATVVVAAVLGVRMFGTGVQYDSLADEVLAHIEHEPRSMRVTDEPVSDRRLASVVNSDVGRLDRSAGLITYAQTCVINGHKVPHLVIQGSTGPVMVLLMPEEHVQEAIPLLDEAHRGVILPVGDGSIAIVGGREEQLEKIERAVTNSVVWST